MQNFYILLYYFPPDDPGIQAAKSTVKVEEGQQADLVVHVSTLNGLNNVRITWQKDGETIASTNGDGTLSLYDFGRRLTFNNVQLSDAGIYNITASRFTSGYVRAKRVIISLQVYSKSISIL